MKKTISALLSAAMLLTLSACSTADLGKTANTDTDTTTTTTASKPQQTETAQPEPAQTSEQEAQTTVQEQAIPDVFPVNSGDTEYFYPETNRYEIYMVDYSAVPVDDMGWSTLFEYLYAYSRVDSHFVNLKSVVLKSYDEAGALVSTKMKLIYPTENDAIYAPVNDADMLIPEDITGVNEQNDSLATAEWFEDMYKQIPSYAARLENVVYYAADGELTIPSERGHIIPDCDASNWSEFTDSEIITSSSDYECKCYGYGSGKDYSRKYSGTASVTAYSCK